MRGLIFSQQDRAAEGMDASIEKRRRYFERSAKNFTSFMKGSEFNFDKVKRFTLILDKEFCTLDVGKRGGYLLQKKRIF